MTQSEFANLFGAAPEVWASAPGRVNIIGEHIDYSDGWVLPFAINYRTNVLVRRREDSLVRLASGQQAKEIYTFDLASLRQSKKWVDYPLGVISELRIPTGVDIFILGDVPNGAGLSSSAALECATALALNEVFKLGHSAKDLALLAQRAENNFVGMPCGIMDQAVSMLATADNALLLDCRTLETTQIPLDLAAADLSLLVIDTRAKHSLVDGGYAARRADCDAAVSALGIPSMREASIELLAQNHIILGSERFNRARHAVTEIARVHGAVAALQSSDFVRLGELMNQSHASLRDDYTVSCPELDAAVDTAVAAGALGARMVGGGFGGSAIALAKTGLIPQLKTAITEAYAASGFAEPRFFIATPAAGARIERI
jgi:galactokinase